MAGGVKSDLFSSNGRGRSHRGDAASRICDGKSTAGGVQLSSCPSVRAPGSFQVPNNLYPCLPRSQGCAHGCQDQSLKQHCHSSDLDPGAPGHHPGTAQGVPSEQTPNSPVPNPHPALTINTAKPPKIPSWLLGLELLDVGMTENFLWSPGAFGFGVAPRICSLGCQDGVGDVSCCYLWAWKRKPSRIWEAPRKQGGIGMVLATEHRGSEGVTPTRSGFVSSPKR